MSALLKFDFQKRKQLHFLEQNYLNYTKKTQFLQAKITFSQKHGETKQCMLSIKTRKITDTPVVCCFGKSLLIPDTSALYLTIGLLDTSRNDYALNDICALHLAHMSPLCCQDTMQAFAYTTFADFCSADAPSQLVW